MSNRYAIEAVDRTLQDVCDNMFPFGGKCIVFSGDFRQTLPIIADAPVPEVVGACFNHSPLWQNIRHMRLRQNMRLDPASQHRAQFLLDVGNGNVPTHPNYGSDFIEMPDELLTSNSLEDLIYHTFGTITESTEFSNKVILCPKNQTVHKINDMITADFPGDETEYHSTDAVDDTDRPNDLANWPVEFLNTLTPNGIPPHKLKLKVGMPIVVLRNILPSQGLCNGTRLKIVQLSPHLIEGVILNGSCVGRTVFIPRISLNITKSRLPFTLSRRQFPVQVAFAMTINKSQGQTIDHVGIYLPEPVFSHGQLYVALSRCPTFTNLHMFIEHGPTHKHTANIVYRAISQFTS